MPKQPKITTQLKLRRPGLLAAAVLSAGFGILILLRASASGVAVPVEAESATLSGSATVVSDAQASGGKAVKFGGSATPTPTPGGTIWQPAVGLTWQWQLTGTVDTSVAAQAFDIDGFDNAASVVSAIHAKGSKAICYFSAGSFEDWRSDAGTFPAAVLGSPLDGWPGEKWLDVRRLDLLGPIMSARLDMCEQKGFDAVEPDNVDGYSNSTGFPLTAADQITYNKYLAAQAHARGMAVFLKNDLGQVTSLLPFFDGALNEQCFQYGECDSLTPFITAGKPVLETEYSLAVTAFCPSANSRRFSAMKKNLNLDAPRTTCW